MTRATTSGSAWPRAAPSATPRRASARPTPGTTTPPPDDDTAVPAGVVCGLAHAGDPRAASELARRYARITHAGDGVDAAAAMAALVARVLTGSPLRDAVDAGRGEIAPGSWLDAGLDTALGIADTAGDPFAAVPSLIRALSPRLYSHASTAAETLPLAVAVTLLTDAEPARAIPLSLTIARKADSVPAFVGALCGAARGRAAFGPEWDALDELRGILLPTLEGVRLSALADRLLARAEHPNPTEDVTP
ncbi:ADP-ribosylglycohydrolase family protein [Microbacterium sp. SORGH_AS_0888]|uniref:ADP-ribosylglycohydrolase family protein n=1 Tax=Microbacterium sp. SORGH_AS_0888 TaxID=3041791 RepID=UPI0027D84747|nr:ADP-ribosylglycohydrolase family protein [Microbacterium sp. SORGH_AS_0888]